MFVAPRWVSKNDGKHPASWILVIHSPGPVFFDLKKTCVLYQTWTCFKRKKRKHTGLFTPRFGQNPTSEGAFESAGTSFESRENADFSGTDGQLGLGEDGHQTGVHWGEVAGSWIMSRSWGWCMVDTQKVWRNSGYAETYQLFVEFNHPNWLIVSHMLLLVSSQ